MVKIVIFDVDGTLRVPEKPVDISVVERMHRLVEYDIQASLVSGKGAVYLYGLAEGIGIPEPLVGGENGAVIFWPQKKVEILYPVADEIKKSLEYVQSYLWHEFRDQIWFPPTQAGVTAFVKPEFPVIKVHESAENFVREHRLDDLYVLPHWDAVDVLPRGLDKGVFVRYLHSIGYKPEEIVAVGDALNDIPMLERAGYSITFKSSLREVKNVADVAVNDIHDAFEIIEGMIIGEERKAVSS